MNEVWFLLIEERDVFFCVVQCKLIIWSGITSGVLGDESCNSMIKSPHKTEAYSINNSGWDERMIETIFIASWMTSILTVFGLNIVLLAKHSFESFCVHGLLV